LALRRIELEEKTERDRLTVEFENEKQTKVDITKKYLPAEAIEQLYENGYFSQLDCTFKATSDDIRNQYLAMTSTLL
jgi:hypothetical protein